MVFTIGIIQITTAKINDIYLLKTREEIKTELKVEISRENKRKGEQFGTGLRSWPYQEKRIYLNYKDTYSVNNGSDYATYESGNSSIVSVDSNGKIRANNTGSTIIYAMDEADANLRMYKVEVNYNFFRGLILIFLFGRIWYWSSQGKQLN